MYDNNFLSGYLHRRVLYLVVKRMSSVHEEEKLGVKGPRKSWVEQTLLWDI